MDLNIATDAERQSAYFMSGGLVAAHSSSRKRQSIWDALERKEVYATSGQEFFYGLMQKFNLNLWQWELKLIAVNLQYSL